MEDITELPATTIEEHRPSSGAGADHPMRIMTRRAAGLIEQPWDSEAAAQVSGLFDSLAPEWHTRESAPRLEVVRDALERGLDRLRDDSGPHGLALEVGSGLGTYSELIDRRFENTVAVEIAEEMHRRARRSAAHRILADASRLPLPDASVSAVILINALLFPAEVDRVLTGDGIVLWVNSSGEQTPIHLSTEEIVRVLPFGVDGVQSRAGAATWCALRRSALR